MATICYRKNNRLPTLKDTLGLILAEMAARDARIAVFDADLANASGLCHFAEKCPDRFIDCGIQEANMIGIAAGCSEAGVIPFVHTFSAFAGRKCADQIFLAGCYSKLNLKILGSDPGITAATNGGSHQGYEDMGILIANPNITLLDPSDSVMAEALLRMLPSVYGVAYMRINRKATLQIYESGCDFEFGKGILLREGDDATVIASGIEVEQALIAADLLADEGIQIRVVDMFCWRPLDRALIQDCAQRTGAVVTAENHNTTNGLGSAVAAAIAQSCPVPMEYIGVKERFGEVGSVEFLLRKFEMDAAAISNAVKRAISRKRT